MAIEDMKGKISTTGLTNQRPVMPKEMAKSKY